MDQFTYTTTSDAWPMRAESKRARFTFSGTFNAARIAAEAAGIATNKLISTIVWGVALVGLGGFLMSAWRIGYADYQIWFLFQPSIWNVIAWTGVVAGLYLWGKSIHDAAEYEVTRVLSEATLQKWQEHGNSVDVYQLYTRGAKDTWNGILPVIKSFSTDAPNAIHVLLALLKHPSIQLVFIRFGVNPDSFKKPLAELLKTYQQDDSALVYKLPYAALEEALRMRNRSVDPLMLLCALIRNLPDKHPIQKVFFNLDLELEKLEVISAWVFNIDILVEEYKIFRKLAKHKSDSGVNRGLTAVPTPYLDQFSQDMTIQAKYHHLPLARGREADLDKIFKLYDGGARNVLIKGPVGTGRKTLVNDIAYHMASEQVPKALEDKRLIKLELAGIVGSKVNPEQALLNIFKEAERSGNIVFVLEDVHIMARAIGTEGLSLLEVLVNHLQNTNIPVIATTTPEEYQGRLRNVANLDAQFVSYELEDLKYQAVMLACCMRASGFESESGAFFQYQAIEEAVRLTSQFFKDVGQPQKSVEILREASQRVKNAPKEEKLITPAMIQKVVAEKTHVPQESFTQNEAEKLLNLEKIIGERVIGQHEAVVAVSEGMRRARSGLSSGTRPLASFLFIGPTGVGKTELAKTLSSVYFGDARYFLRLDMSEYQGSDGMRKLIGSAEGQDVTPFISHLKTYPFSLFLLDELEKASPDILNLFLQVLDDGRITTGGGKTLDLTHTIIIATSNAGTPEILTSLKEGKTIEEIKQVLLSKILINYFRPEFINRFDGTIIFKPLQLEEVEKIAALQLKGVSKNLLEKGIKLAFSEHIVKDVAVKGFDPLLGGRPIRRYIQDHVESVIAKLLLTKQLTKGFEGILDMDEKGEYRVTNQG